MNAPAPSSHGAIRRDLMRWGEPVEVGVHGVPAHGVVFGRAGRVEGVFGVYMVVGEKEGQVQRDVWNHVFGVDQPPGGDGKLVEAVHELQVADFGRGESAESGDVEFALA